MLSKVSVTVWAEAAAMPQAQQTASRKRWIQRDASQLDCVMVILNAVGGRHSSILTA
jgi:hypothetical protein